MKDENRRLNLPVAELRFHDLGLQSLCRCSRALIIGLRPPPLKHEVTDSVEGTAILQVPSFGVSGGHCGLFTKRDGLVAGDRLKCPKMASDAVAEHIRETLQGVLRLMVGDPTQVQLTLHESEEGRSLHHDRCSCF